MTDATSPKTLRWSVGMLIVDRPEYVYVKIKILDEPPLPPFLSEEGCFQLHGDVFGGDAGSEQGGKDHLWRYYDPTHAFIDNCSLFQKESSTMVASSGTTFTFQCQILEYGSSDRHQYHHHG